MFNFLKHKSVLLLFILALVMVPAASYALIDASVYGGYAFASMESEAATKDITGWEYGCRGHINTGIPMLLTIGVGGFYQVMPLETEIAGETVDVTKTTYGIDVYAQLDLPILPVNPFVRYGIAIKDELEVELANSRSENLSDNWKSSYVGGGLAYPLFDLVVIDLKIFAEYLYTTTKQENDIKINGHVVNAGLQLSI